MRKYTLILNLLVGAVVMSAPVNCAEEQSVRGSNQLSPYGARRQLPEADKKQLESLWKIMLERSIDLKRITERLKDSGWTEKRISEHFDDVFHEATSEIATTSSHQTGLSLTIPSLEPTYPVPGGQGPVYLLPAQAKHAGRSFHSGTAIGDGVGVARQFLWRKSEESRIFENLQTLYRRYKWNCNRQVPSKSVCESLRQELVELVGEDAVNKLDIDLGFER